MGPTYPSTLPCSLLNKAEYYPHFDQRKPFLLPELLSSPPFPRFHSFPIFWSEVLLLLLCEVFTIHEVISLIVELLSLHLRHSVIAFPRTHSLSLMTVLFILVSPSGSYCYMLCVDWSRGSVSCLGYFRRNSLIGEQVEQVLLIWRFYDASLDTLLVIHLWSSSK